MSVDRSLFQSLSCRCSATACDIGWRIEAEAFLCPYRHKQGQIISGDDAAAEGERLWSYERAAMKEHDLDA